jgi:hypothetical protein
MWLTYGGLGLWGVSLYRSAFSRKERYLSLSILIVAALVLATDVLASFEPQLAALLHHPVGTALGLVMAGLVLWTISIKSRRDD